MKRIFLTDSFQKQLKKFKRQFSEQDVLKDIKSFVHGGLRKHETYLKLKVIDTIPLKIAKLRLNVYQVHARYILGVMTEGNDFIPIFIDLKTGKHGENLSFESSKYTQNAIESALEKVINDYSEHTQENPRMKVFIIKD